MSITSIILAPGAFKGSVSATRVAQIMEIGLRKSGLKSNYKLIPLADGGDGTLDALLINGGERLSATVRDPLGREIQAAWGLLPDKTAVIEMALASGLSLLHPDEVTPENVLKASTFGTGQLILHALDAGAKRIIIGMGGSATVDGGAGCLSALGFRIVDENGVDIPLGGGFLSKSGGFLAKNGGLLVGNGGLLAGQADPRLRSVEIIIATDVNNPALGEQGAAAVFAPQKGASPREVALLEANLRHFFTLVYDQLNVDVREVQGGGAAGAFSAGLMAFLGGHIQSGIELMMQISNFDAHLREASLVITGEGRLDTQSLSGKTPIGIAQRAAQFNVKTIALVGGVEGDETMLHEAGIWAVMPIIPAPMPLEEAMQNAESLIERAALRLGYLLQLSETFDT